MAEAGGATVKRRRCWRGSCGRRPTRAVASIVTATLEGAVMLTKLYGEPTHMRHVIDHLTTYLASLAVPSESGSRAVG
ncbi:MAG: hypothetical protein U0232_25190 [Thermomicrobiales bacterium]